MKTFLKHNGQVIILEGVNRADISAQALSLGISDPFDQSNFDSRTARQKAKDLFLSLPVTVRAQFLTEWSAINNALDLGDKQAALFRFDSLTVPSELLDAKASIRTHIESI